MDNQILTDIVNYVNFLRHCGFAVTLKSFGNKFEPYTTVLLNYDFHIHEICRYLKINKSTIGMCRNANHKLEKVVFDKPRYTCCYAGLEEFIIPVNYKDTFLLNIHVSGYRGGLEKSYVKMLSISKMCDNRFKELYNQLSDNVPTMEDVLSFVNPLKYMIIDLYKHCRRNYENTDNLSVTKRLYLKIMKYIHENFMRDISCSSIAKEMKYSTSYLRYVFQKESDASISNKILEIRLNYALHYLCNTELNITEIAFNCGFGDSNYFSTVFKKKYGIAPTLYRTKHHNEQIDVVF